MKVVINKCYGGFGLSKEALDQIAILKGHEVDQYNLERNDEEMVFVVEELGEKANGNFAALVVVKIPDDVEWEIDEYDGIEHIAEAHRTWYE